MERFGKIFIASLISFLLGIGVSSIGLTPVTNLHAQGGSLSVVEPTQSYAPMVFTATAQTKTQALASSSCALITQSAVAITTATFTIKVSNDGTNYFPAAVAPYVGSATRASVLTAITVTTSPNLFIANVAGAVSYQVVTSGTFTATSLTIKVTSTGNPCPGGV